MGQYSKSRQSELFRDEFISPRLGAERLRYLMHSGQEVNSSSFFHQIRRMMQFGHVLDCGAGFGGNSWILADRYHSTVDALTISPGQVEHMQILFGQYGLLGSIAPKLGNAFASDWWHGQPYDLIIGFESFCQMGNPTALIRNLSRFQTPGGVIGISDHFMRRKESRIARYFDEYWVSDSSELGEMLVALNNSGYRLESLRDRTDGQIPYWRLSQAYSMLPTQDRSDDRRSQTFEFHRAMESGYINGDVQYVQLIARRVNQ